MNLREICRQRLAALAAVAAILVALGGCGGAGEQAGKMTSFSTAESAGSKAELFSLPADQMSHIQVVTVEQGSLARTLRLTGAVEYNDFKTTPVITQVGGPVSRVVVVQGEHVRAGQALLYVASPDYSLLRSAYHQGPRRLAARGQVLSPRARPLRAPRHCPGRPRAS